MYRMKYDQNTPWIPLRSPHLSTTLTYQLHSVFCCCICFNNCSFHLVLAGVHVSMAAHWSTGCPPRATQTKNDSSSPSQYHLPTAPPWGAGPCESLLHLSWHLGWHELLQILYTGAGSHVEETEAHTLLPPSGSLIHSASSLMVPEPWRVGVTKTSIRNWALPLAHSRQCEQLWFSAFLLPLQTESSLTKVEWSGVRRV